MLIVSPMLERLADRISREKIVITRNWETTSYLTRWVLIGSTNADVRTVYLHRFERSDADDMHDHPWPFSSIILAGGYYEVTPAKGWSNGQGPTRKRWYGPGRVLNRPAAWIHRIEIPDGHECWTLVFRGIKVRSWGFWCPMGWRPWRDHFAAANRTNGNGCAP